MNRDLCKSFLFAFILLFAFMPFSQAADFTDLTEAHPNFAAISSLVEQGVLQGYSEDQSFRPEQSVNRAEALKIILLGAGIEVNPNSNSAVSFTDVNAEDWYFRLLGTAVDLGLIQGYDDGSFRAGSTVNLAEAAKISSEAAKTLPAKTLKDTPFPDVQKDKWFWQYGAEAEAWNLFPVQNDGLWHPEKMLTRAEIAELVVRRQMVSESSSPFNEALNWPRKDFIGADISLKVPFGWFIKQDGLGAIWTLDHVNGQYSMLNPYNNGVTLLVTRYANVEGLDVNALLGGIKINPGSTSERIWIQGYPALVVNRYESIIYKDWYLVLDNGTLTHLQGLRGNGFFARHGEARLESIVNSVMFEPKGAVDMDEEIVLEALYSGVNVDGSGESLLAAVNDKKLIETDSIGVGTGPVDYYYSPILNITIKYERSFDVILAIEDGETSGF